MTLVKTCPTCGLANVPTIAFCTQCGVSLVAVGPSERVEPEKGQCDNQSSEISKSVCPDCKAENEEGADRCVYCDYPLTSTEGGTELCHVELSWPWGKELLTKPMRIGREPPARESLIKAINAHGYDNISRSHAELQLDLTSGAVTVVDLSSTNGTFVDGVRIPPNMPTVLQNGAVVRFAANLSVIVSIVPLK